MKKILSIGFAAIFVVLSCKKDLNKDPQTITQQDITVENGMLKFNNLTDYEKIVTQINEEATLNFKVRK